MTKIILLMHITEILMMYDCYILLHDKYDNFYYVSKYLDNLCLYLSYYLVMVNVVVFDIVFAKYIL